MLTDEEIIDSWHENSSAWIKAIKNEEIESRVTITNGAILERIIRQGPKNILDLGCGEGWLARELFTKKMNVFGIDASPMLIEHANKMGQGRFDVCSYENLPQYQFQEKFDCIVCNFSLIGKESTEIAISTSADLLQKNGALIIQTVHPVVASLDANYEEGWRAGSWSGFSEDFKKPAPWYFRTIEDWFMLLNKSGFHRINIREPVHPKTGRPASIIFECRIH
ncbi:MAG: class SAM-dependent methyltransferase [Gammaproteobacteria bacterium]|jgi:2-polyprenyl-3-methyl-5-hydroxy-6-metoxy-1,4-benzoquinol methylase|nr:class SAM-dependent methyltransferase [Gammaproteobacteria bacterium]